MTKSVLLWSRRLFALSMVVLLAVVVARGASEVTFARGIWFRLGVAAVLSFGGLVAGGLSWSVVSGSPPRQAVAAFGATLPIRHLPLGGIGQLFGLAGISKAGGDDSISVSSSVVLFMASTAGGACLVAVPVLWSHVAPFWLKVFVSLGLLATAAVIWNRGYLARRALAGFRSRRAPLNPVPMGMSIAWSTISMLGAGAAFAMLFPDAGSWIHTVSAFAAAWLCGFVFVLAPAGIGVREGVLVSMFPGFDTSTVIAVGLAHRFATLVAEVVLFGIAWKLSSEWVGLKAKEPT